MSFVDLATLAVHRRNEMEARLKIFLEKCDTAVRDIDKLKSQACGFLENLNCEPSELKDRFLSSMRQLDEYTYLITDFNLALSKLDLPSSTYISPVQDRDPYSITTSPALPVPTTGEYNLMDALSEPTPSTSKACSNMTCPPEKPLRRQIPREEQMLIMFSSASCSSESVPFPINETKEKQVQCQIDKDIKKLSLDDSSCANECNLPAQSILQVDQVYHACIMNVDGLTLWVVTEDIEDISNFITDMTNFYKNNSVELKPSEVSALTYCAYYDDDGGYFYRGLLIPPTEENRHMAEVFLVDTGEVRCAPLSSIQPLYANFCKKPPYARCCHLAGIDINNQSKEAAEQQEEFVKNAMNGRCRIKIDDNSSESLGVFVILSDGKVLNDLVVQRGFSQPIDQAATRNNNDGLAELDDRCFDITQCPEYEDPVEAVTGYRNRDEMEICKHYKGGPERSCFKGARCTKRHVLMHPDGWTLDRVPVVARVPSQPLAAPGTWLQVTVTHVAYYNKLFVKFHDDKTQDIMPPTFGVVLPPATLENLVQDMNSPATRMAYKPLQMIPAPGELVAALYPCDEQWYRARVLSTSPAEQNVEVQYIDYGNIAWVKEDAVRTLEPRWCALPAQAVRCVLAGVRVDSPAPRHHTVARDALAALANERRLEAHVISRDYDEITVELFDDKGFNIAEQLIATGHVKAKPYSVVDDSDVKRKIVVP